MIKRFSVVLVVAAAVMWGIIGVFINSLSDFGFLPVEQAAFRSVFSAPLIFIFLLIFDRSKLKISPKDLPLFISGAVVSIVIFHLSYVTAIKHGTMGLAAALLYTAPVFVTIISAIIFKEKMTISKISALTLCVFGSVFVSGVFGGTANPAAVFFGVLSGLTYGLYSIFSKFALKNYSPITFMAYTTLIAAVVFIPFINFKNTISIISDKPLITLFLVFYAICSYLLPFLCYNTALKYIDAGKASIIATLELVVATLAGVIIYSEKMTVYSIVGVILMLVGCIVLNIKFRRRDI